MHSNLLGPLKVATSLVVLLVMASAVHAHFKPSETVFLVRSKPGPSWNKSLEMKKQAGMSSHAFFLRNLYQQGHIRLGGNAKLNLQSILIVDGADAKSVEALFASDPAVLAGSLRYDVESMILNMKRAPKKPKEHHH
ncbi:MAG: hypothetical protein GY822_18120 [Deltaproteobacteria bacterium]|nr:hypothetical protein [Deltaproteobacteria bacterium]